MAGTSAQKSSPWVYVILLIVIGLTVWTAMQDEDDATESVVALAKENKPKIIKPKANKPLADLLEAVPNQNREARQPQQRKIVNLFKTKQWYSPPPVRKVAFEPTQAVQPTAPPLPFKYNGKLEGVPGGTIVFLLQGKKLFTTQIGQKVNATWRLDAETERALAFTYLPLDLKRTLSKSASSNGFSQATREPIRPMRQLIED